MKGKEKLSIAYIHKNWISIRNKRSSQSLSRHNTKGSSNSSNLSKDNKKLSQEGYYHVFVRGYNSYTLFYDIEDRVHFLSILEEESKKTRAKIMAFILMDNHFHLQVFTSQLSNLMGMTLQRYSVRFKRKYGIDGPVFKKTFGRSQIFSSLLVKENLLYILSNASRENMCATHRDYIWSSYNAHPEVILLRKVGMLPLPVLGLEQLEHPKKKLPSSKQCRESLPSPKRRRGSVPSAETFAQSDISQVIKVDPSFMLSAFKDLEDLDNAIHSYEPLKNHLRNIHQPDGPSIDSEPLNVQLQNVPNNNKIITMKPDYEVIALFVDLLNGRKFSMITNYERAQIINKLKREKGATRRQISTILRIKY